MYEIYVLSLEDNGYLTNIFATMKKFVSDRLRFEWFKCDVYEKDIKSNLLDSFAIFIIANECFKDFNLTSKRRRVSENYS